MMVGSVIDGVERGRRVSPQAELGRGMHMKHAWGFPL